MALHASYIIFEKFTSDGGRVRRGDWRDKGRLLEAAAVSRLACSNN